MSNSLFDIEESVAKSLFTPLKEKLEQYLEPAQIQAVRRAYTLAAKGHKEQKRRSGEPYITHPIAVASILADMRMDPQTIMAAILHDVLEDTLIDKDTIIKKFGEPVAELVDGVSKLTQIDFATKAEAQAENFRKMVLAMAKDIRVILIKLADRLHNMRTLGHMPSEKRCRIAKETMEIYAPIAHRLGMHVLCLELEDLGFQARYPLRYKVLKHSMERMRGNRHEMISVIEHSIKQALEEKNFPPCIVWGREKHLYSIYRKMCKKHISLSEIMDVYAFRIITDSIDTCYRVLGVVHNLYKPVPERFKDYIAIPKTNGYQSLHTTLFGPYGVPIEIQIRTDAMHKMAENGISAHWLYKSEGDITSDAQLRAQQWLKGLIEMQQSVGNSLEFIENVKIDLFPEQVYVFTPKGHIIELPSDATLVDFAYAIHSDIGNSCVAAKIDRRLSPLSTVLSNGDTVEVITAPGAKPNPAWLNFVTTGKARTKIRQYLKKQGLAEAAELGRRMLDKALAGMGKALEDIPQDNLDNLMKTLKTVKHVEDLYTQIGLGNYMPQIVAHRLVYNTDSEHKLTETEVLSINGTEGMVVNFATCCYPLPGDPIVGELHEGRGITIHLDRCEKIKKLRTSPDKLIPVRWEAQVQGEYLVPILLEARNQRGVLGAIANTIADTRANIENISVNETDGNFSHVRLVLAVTDRQHLARVMRKLRALKVVNKIIRRI